MLTHGNLTWNCYNLLIDLDLTTNEVALISAPMFHTAALNHTALPVFLKGGTNVLVSKFSPENSFDLIAEHRITLIFGVPAMFRQIAAVPALGRSGPDLAADPALRRIAGSRGADPHATRTGA